MARRPIGEFYQLDGGMDDKADPIEIPPNTFRSLVNFTVQRNSVHTRNGYITEFNTALNGGATVQRAFQHRVISDQTVLDTYIVGGKLYAGASQTDITNGITIASGGDTRPVLATWEGNLIGTDGTNQIFRSTDPSSAAATAVMSTADGIPATAAMVVPYKDHIVFLDCADEQGARKPYRAVWTDPFDVRKVDTDSFKHFDRDQALTAAVNHNDFLLVFMEKSTHAMYLEARDANMPFVFPQVAGNVGCPAFDCAINTEKGTFFIGQPNKGIYWVPPTSGAQVPGPPRYISKPLETFFSGINWSRVKYSCVGEVPEKNLVVFGVPYGSGQINNNRFIVLNYDQWSKDADGDPHPAYSIWRGTSQNPFEFASAYTIEDSDGRSRLICGGYDGFVYLMDEGSNDAGEDITSTWEGPYWRFGSRGREALFLGLAVDGKLTTQKLLTVTYRAYRGNAAVQKTVSGGLTGYTFGNSHFGSAQFGGNPFGTIPAQLVGRGRFLQVNGSISDPFELHGMTVFGDYLNAWAM